MPELTRYQMLIDGQWSDAQGGASFESVNPASGEVWAEIPAAAEADVERAVQAAHRAFTVGPWASMTPSERGKRLRKFADLLAENAEALGRIESVDTGKLFKETRFQAKYIADFFHYYAGLADKIEGSTLPIDKPDHYVFNTREPLGVVAAVVPWNSQLFLTAIKMGPALAAGNTIVLKASEHASAALLAFGRLVAEAGIPDGVVNIVTGFGEPCGRVLTSHPLVARVSFTGGPETARHVVRNSAENFAQVTLELGGKSPVVVFEDADIESATNGVVSGIFAASGQSCVAGSRLYLQDAIADTFIEGLVARAGKIRIGDPLAEETQMGPLATQAQLTRIDAEVKKAQESGAKLLHGGRPPPHLNTGWFYEPTIVECPDQSLSIVDHGAVRSGAERAAFFERRRGHRARQRHQIRPRLRHLFPRYGARAQGLKGDPGGHRLDQHLPHGLAHHRDRRLQGQRLRARRRAAGGLRLHPVQDGLDQHLERAGGRPLRDALGV